jgi:CMP-N-acetylneuraminic acid synthetase
MKTVAFVPIRLNSKRVIGKNLKLLGGKPLLSYIFETLITVDGIDEIYAFCSDNQIIPFLPSSISFLERDPALDGDFVLGKEIYDSFCNQVKADIYILAHTTSPFIKKETIETALNNVKSGIFDSSFSAEKKQTFAWYRGLPLNYSLESVPRTQDIEPVYIETSAFFIFKEDLWKNRKRRIGYNPFICIIDPIEAVDIDNPIDFEIAEKIINSNI